jgi:hypothetical protein
MATQKNDSKSKFGLRPERVEAKERIYTAEKELNGPNTEAQEAARAIEEREEEQRRPSPQEPPQAPKDEDADKNRHAETPLDKAPLDPAGSFSPGAVPSVSAPGPSANLRKKLNDLPNAADDPKRNDIPAKLKI